MLINILKSQVKRLLVYIFGLVIFALGIALTIIANLGAGSWSALNVGLSDTIGFTVGSWVIIIGIIIIFINAILLKKRPDFYSLLTILIQGYLIDFWLLVVFREFITTLLVFKISLLGIGIVLMALGISLYMQSKLGIIPIDRLMVVVQQKFSLNLMKSKTIGELGALVFAYLFNGPIGIGTIFVTILMGPLIQFFFYIFEKTFSGSSFKKIN